MDFNNYVKPCVWVILPELFRSLGNSQAMRNTITTIVNSYEVPVEEYNAQDKYIAIDDADTNRITPIDQTRRRDNESELVHIIEEIMNDRFSINDMRETFKDSINSISTSISGLFGGK